MCISLRTHAVCVGLAVAVAMAGCGSGSGSGCGCACACACVGVRARVMLRVLLYACSMACCIARASADETVTSMLVQYNLLQTITGSFDLCPWIANGQQLRCPQPAGPLALNVTFNVPFFVPTDIPVIIQLDVFDQSAQEVTCLLLQVEF